MNASDRPSVSPAVIAAIIESAPDRVRRRLDRSPDAAGEWKWIFENEAWSITAGNETVTLAGQHLTSVDQLSCSCLLTPNCFHIAACLTSLEVALLDDHPQEVEPEETQDSVQDATDPAGVELSDEQKKAVAGYEIALTRILDAGVANAGVFLQSQLLRAIHQCRAAGLHRIAATGVRILTGVTEFRKRAPEQDSLQLALDLAETLEAAHHLQASQPVADFWIGTARRAQFPVNPRKLQGVLAEPVMTRSGYAGASVLFLGADDQFYTVGEVRPGDEQLARDAYRGGVQMGSLIQPAQKLARSSYLGTELTASREGRLGRGTRVKIVEQGESSWQSPEFEKRFQRPLNDQWNAAFNSALLPPEERPAGWDLVFLTGTVLGICGPVLLFELSEHRTVIELAIENDHPALCFRENLRMLSYAPGLALKIVGRLSLQSSLRVFPLAAVQAESADAANNDERPWLNLPPEFQGRLFLGFDELQRAHLQQAQPTETVLAQLPTGGEPDQLSVLRRRWIALMIGGLSSQRKTNQSFHATDLSQLKQHGFETAAALLDRYPSIAANAELTIADLFLASAVYLKHCQLERARALALHYLETGQGKVKQHNT